MFKNPESAFEHGIVIRGKKYVAIQANKSSIYGKQGAKQVVLIKTNKMILLGIHDNQFILQKGTLFLESLGENIRKIGL